MLTLEIKNVQLIEKHANPVPASWRKLIKSLELFRIIKCLHFILIISCSSCQYHESIEHNYLKIKRRKRNEFKNLVAGGGESVLVVMILLCPFFLPILFKRDASGPTVFDTVCRLQSFVSIARYT